MAERNTFSLEDSKVTDELVQAQVLGHIATGTPPRSRLTRSFAAEGDQTLRRAVQSLAGTEELTEAIRNADDHKKLAQSRFRELTRAIVAATEESDDQGLARQTNRATDFQSSMSGTGSSGVKLTSEKARRVAQRRDIPSRQ